VRDRDESKRGPVVDANRGPADQPGRTTLAERADPEPGVADLTTTGQRHQFHTTKPGALYDDNGRVLASVVPAYRAVSVHAGTIRRLVPDGEARVVECVYVVDASGRAGWMPTSCFPSVAVREERYSVASTPVRAAPAARRFRIRHDLDSVPLKKRRLIATALDGTPDLEADGWALDEYDECVIEREGDELAYGYVENELGERIYGWIDPSLLGDEL
jgi:hypothetical protein